MKKHTTQHGDQFLLSQITDTSSWSEKNRRRDHIDSTATAFLTWSAAIAGVLIFLAIITFLSV